VSHSDPEHLRRYVLPWAGFRLEGNYWINATFHIPEMRKIADYDVGRYHTPLVSYLSSKMTLEHYYEVLEQLMKFRRK